MKPKNKFQQRIVEASKTLPKLTDVQVDWGYKHCIEHIAHKTKKGIITCLDCGHRWTDEDITAEHCTCPNCKLKLKVEETRKRTFLDYEYLCVVTAHKGYQVLRFLYIECNMKVGEKAHYFHSEVVQKWIAPDGRHATMAKLRPMGFFVHGWIYHSRLEIRPEKTLYNITPTEVYPRQKMIPELKRTGYKKTFGKLTPFDTIHFLLAESKAETLLKAGQRKLFEYFAYDRSRKINGYWPSIRICLRNGYPIKDAQIWCDYIDLLCSFEKDLRNAKYVCPDNLKAEHDKYVKKRREWLKKQDAIDARRKAQEDEAYFKEIKSKFFGIQFSDGLIQVHVLESVDEIMQEGDAMKHCLFTNKYHLKPDSLILSACINEQRLETIELSLTELKVLQSRGISNKITKYHQQIIKLVENNIPLIQEKLAA
ncbi:MAG: PcfJ domain-containing protein [Prevotella sp.]|jgi:hypothetical protein|nr:PcfJ domain-containing protein [Prevotella sp.]